jgi:hypothetical protein
MGDKVAAMGDTVVEEVLGEYPLESLEEGDWVVGADLLQFVQFVPAVLAFSKHIGGPPPQVAHGTANQRLRGGERGASWELREVEREALEVEVEELLAGLFGSTLARAKGHSWVYLGVDFLGIYCKSNQFASGGESWPVFPVALVLK